MMTKTRISVELSPAQLRDLRQFLDEAFDGDFGDDDWRHTLGGRHVTVVVEGRIAAHASVVPRVLVAGGRPLRTGYVEGVATRADLRRTGLATAVMRTVGRSVDEHDELGALSDGSGVPGFYERLGWERWHGPTFVAPPPGSPAGLIRTAEDDDGVLVRRTTRTTGLDLTAPLVCDWRPGDPW